MKVAVAPPDRRRAGWRRTPSAGALLALAGTTLALAGLTGCGATPHVLSHAEQHVIDRQFVEYPPGYEFRRYIAGLTAPTAFDFDDDGNLIIAEDGLGDYSPRIIGFRPNHTEFNVYPLYTHAPLNLGTETFDMKGPIGGLACYKGKIYVSHRDRNDFGVITALDYYGGHQTVLSGLPAQGEYGVTQLKVDTRSGQPRIYFGVGSATNSGVVGLDDYEMGWLPRHPEVCDKLGRDKIRTTGQRFDTPNPFAVWFSPALAVTTGLMPFNVSNQTVIRSRTDKPNASICSVAVGGGPVRVEAIGVHNPRGLAFSPFGLYFTNDGMQPRGTRPILNDPDTLDALVPGTYYGYPDYSSDMRPVTDPYFQPPVAMVIRTGYPDIDMLINHDLSNLVAPSASTLLTAVFPSESGAAGMTFVPENSPLNNDFSDNAIVALSGDTAPFGTGGLKLIAPVGFKVVRVDVDRKQVHEFIHNTLNLPASKTRKPQADELERPIDVKVGPDGGLYVLDLGHTVYKHGKPVVDSGAGQVFRLLPTPPPLGTQPSH